MTPTNPDTDLTAMKLHGTTDASVWTNEFDRIYPDSRPDWATMFGWFANAIEVGRMFGVRETLTSTPDPLREALDEAIRLTSGPGNGTMTRRRSIDEWQRLDRLLRVALAQLAPALTPTPDPLLALEALRDQVMSRDARSASPVTTWFRDDCECSARDPDGDGCYLTADFTDGLCRHCHGHALAALMPAALAEPQWEDGAGE